MKKDKLNCMYEPCNNIESNINNNRAVEAYQLVKDLTEQKKHN